MPQPTPYSRSVSFTDWTINNPSAPQRGQDLDGEFDALAASSAAVVARLGLLQRDDGELRDVVGRDQLKPEFFDDLLADISASGLVGPQGPAGPAIPGPAGLPGPQGPTLAWIVSTGAPNALIGASGQLYLNADNGDVWQRGVLGWQLLANIRGPEGPGGGGGGGSGVTDHGALTGLADPDHPISAVSGLQAALDGLQAALQLVGNSTLKIYSQAGAPTAALNAGDLWFDTDDGNKLYRWNGATWVDTTDARLNTALANASAAISAAAGAQAAADGKVTTFFTATPPASPALGDLWFRSDLGNLLHRWSGSAWVALQDGSIGDAILAAANAQSTADGKIDSFYQPTAPTNGSLGDLWVDTDDQNHLYRHNGAQWVSIRDATIAIAFSNAAAAVNAASTAQATADGKIDVFYQATAPVTGIAVGDLWIDTDDRQLYRYNGTSWASMQDAAIQGALTAAALAEATADGKITAFYQSAAPTTGMQTGDLWYDTDDQNRPYRYNGSVWVDLSPIVGLDAGQATGISIKDGAITALKLAANSVTASKIAADSVNATHIDVATLSAIAADLGTITAGVIALSSSGHIRAGQTAYNTGVGFFLGFDSGVPKFSIGNPATGYLVWDGTTLRVNAVDEGMRVTVTALAAQASGAAPSGSVSGQFAAPAITGGVAPFTYLWELVTPSYPSSGLDDATAQRPVVGAAGIEAGPPATSTWRLTVTDAVNRKAITYVGARLRWVDTT